MNRFLLLAIAAVVFLAQPLGAQEEGEPLELSQEEESPDTAPEAAPAPAPEAEEDLEPEPEPEPEPMDPELAYIDMEIRTSSLRELAYWARELGLSEGGSREDLALRLRSYYGIRTGEGPPDPDERIITIESARTSQYFTLEAVGEEYARFTGDVIITLRDGNAFHRIQAWEILFNRTRNVLTASGTVEYTKEEEGTIETFRGESITVNLDNWSSIFLDGASERSVDGNATAYRFSGTIISRTDEEVTVLTQAVITNPAHDEAFWSLRASKLWLLPGNDFALLNGVLRVGNIPVFYIPFFYYPSDQVIFHPVLGYRSRAGTFLQTTTYILGRPTAESISENSITRVFGGTPDDMEMRREGIFLRSTGRRSTDPNDLRLSVLFDTYVNLGGYLGAELVMPRQGIFGPSTFSAGLGLTRNVYPMIDSHTPFQQYDGVSEWNRTMLFSRDFPLRYRFEGSGSLSHRAGSFSWSFPFYSDPFVNRDFMQRMDLVDWLGMLRQRLAATAATLDEGVHDNPINSYEWRLSGSLNFSTARVSPYISALSLSSFSSSLSFRSRNSFEYRGPLSPANPGRAFFYPDRFTMYSLSAAVAGTPFTTRRGSFWRTDPVTGPAPGEDLLPEEPISPFEDREALSRRQVSLDAFNLAPPSLGQTFVLPRTGGPVLSLDYRITPTTAAELQFQSMGWQEQEDIDWSEVSTILSRVRSDANAGINLNHEGGGAYSSSLRFFATGSWQDFMFLNEEAPEFMVGGAPDQQRIRAARNRAYSETFFTSTWEMSSSIRPFYQSPVWGNTSVQHQVRGLVGRTVVDVSGEEPSWEWVRGEWEKEYIDTHRLSANIAANVMNYNQNLSFSVELPPIDSAATSSATIRAWISETSVRNRVIYPWDPEKREFDPVYFTETLRFSSWGSFQQYIVYDPKNDNITTFTSNLNLWGLSASYSALYSRPFRFNPLYGQPGTGNQPLYIQLTEEKLEPRELRLTYTQPLTRDGIWENRLRFNANLRTSLAFDLQRYTNSRLTFSLSFNFFITNFIDLNLSMSSENTVVFKYFQHWPMFNLPMELYPNEDHGFFRDLTNSFRFDDMDLRRRSGFKMRSLSLGVMHYLGDWNALLSIQTTPHLPQGSRSYQFSNEISFIIQWVPISEIRTQIDYSQRQEAFVAR